jgi:hypothetical protein
MHRASRAKGKVRRENPAYLQSATAFSSGSNPVTSQSYCASQMVFRPCPIPNIERCSGLAVECYALRVALMRLPSARLSITPPAHSDKGQQSGAEQEQAGRLGRASDCLRPHFRRLA